MTLRDLFASMIEIIFGIFLVILTLSSKNQALNNLFCGVKLIIKNEEIKLSLNFIILIKNSSELFIFQALP